MTSINTIAPKGTHVPQIEHVPPSKPSRERIKHGNATPAEAIERTVEGFVRSGALDGPEQTKWTIDRLRQMFTLSEGQAWAQLVGWLVAHPQF